MTKTDYVSIEKTLMHKIKLVEPNGILLSDPSITIDDKVKIHRARQSYKDELRTHRLNNSI